MRLQRMRRQLRQVNLHLPESTLEAIDFPKTMNDHELDNMLRSAKGSFPFPRDFQHGVWSRIEFEAETGNVWQRLLAWTGRPLGVACGVATMVSLGLFLGAATIPKPTDLRLSYMESISPFVHLANR